jgi:2-phospho-L-lactate guanylyltransferase (CobY/MobA/RfbA family)
MEDNPTRLPPALDEATRRQFITQLLKHAASTSAATVPLDQSDAELLDEVVKLRSENSTGLVPALDPTTRQQLFLELLKHATEVGAAIGPRELSDAELLTKVARVHGGALQVLSWRPAR